MSVEREEQLAAQLSCAVCVVEHGLFPPELVSDLIVAWGERIEHSKGGHGRHATR